MSWFSPKAERFVEIKNTAGDILARIPGHDLHNKDLRGLVLNHAVFDGQELWGSNFDGCSMVGVQATRASFQFCSLKNVDLSYARLERASFANAEMQGACLYKAETWGAKLEGALVSPDTDIPDNPKTGRGRMVVRERRLVA